MAGFYVDGLEFGLEALAELPGQVIDDMLRAEGEVLAAYQRAELDRMGLVDTGTLRDSIRVRLKNTGRRRYGLVYPDGVRAVGAAAKESTNNDVGFVLEFGAPERGVGAYQWMRLANAKGEDAAIAAAEAVYHRWLDELGL